MSAAQIRDAVALARRRLPNLPADYADRAIAAGKSLTDVKSDLFGEMTVRERGKDNMRAQIALSGEGREALHRAGADAAPRPVNARARGKALMAEEVRRQGMTPKL